MASNYHHIKVESPEAAIIHITLQRPEAANALNRKMAEELLAAFALPASCRVVIMRGAGEKAFCAGADLKERRGMDETAWHAQHHAFEQALHAIMACPVPVIAAVNGAAYGGGLELAMACDFIYAAEHASFALPEATLGIMPGLGGTQQLPRAIGSRRAKELLYTGAPFTAQDAVHFGLVNCVFPLPQLCGAALATATRIATSAPLSVKSIKAAVNKGSSLPIEASLACELSYYGTLLASRDRHEGINAFNEKRPPVFRGE